MSRSSTLVSGPGHALLVHPHARVDGSRVTGPLSWLNPTRARFHIIPYKHPPTPSSEAQSSSLPDAVSRLLPAGAQMEWRARDNRKGRHALIVPKQHEDGHYPPLTNSWAGVRTGLWRMCTVFAWWDVSWWIAVLFSVGCAIFVVSGLFYWLPLAAPSSEFRGEGLAGGLTAFIGATFFQVGAVLLIVEAANENQSGCFGWALEHAFSHSDSEGEKAPNGTKTSKAKDECLHHHMHGIHKRSTLNLQHPEAGRKWEWWPTWQELTHHYFNEIGFLASFILAIGATIFYISGIMAIPQIYDNLSQGVKYGVYWLAYLVGGVLFVVAAVLYLLETQQNWYTPAPHLLGWWIGIWNLIGAVGWTLSAGLGYCSVDWCEYQSELSLLWASIAYLIGSLLLWYEALDKYPVEREKN